MVSVRAEPAFFFFLSPNEWELRLFSEGERGLSFFSHSNLVLWDKCKLKTHLLPCFSAMNLQAGCEQLRFSLKHLKWHGSARCPGERRWRHSVTLEMDKQLWQHWVIIFQVWASKLTAVQLRRKSSKDFLSWKESKCKMRGERRREQRRGRKSLSQAQWPGFLLGCNNSEWNDLAVAHTPCSMGWLR